jgi:hypothetical protein
MILYLPVLLNYDIIFFDRVFLFEITIFFKTNPFFLKKMGK